MADQEDPNRDIKQVENHSQPPQQEYVLTTREKLEGTATKAREELIGAVLLLLGTVCLSVGVGAATENWWLSLVALGLIFTLVGFKMGDSES